MIGKYFDGIGGIVYLGVYLSIGQIGKQSTHRGSDAHLQTVLVIFLGQRTKRLKVLSAVVGIAPFGHHLRKSETIDDAFEQVGDREISNGPLKGAKLLNQRTVFIEPEVLCVFLVFLFVFAFKTHQIVKATLKDLLRGLAVEQSQEVGPNVFVRGVDHKLQEGEDQLYLCLLKDVIVDIGYRNALFDECLSKASAFFAFITKDGHVAIL